MIRIIIIDDEEDARVNLRFYLDQFCEGVEIVGEADTVKSGVDLIQNTEFDLLFLDVRLSPGSGFDILEALDAIDFQIIFVTAYDEYAIRAIRFSALDYLLKPVDLEELSKSLDKVREMQEASGQNLRVEIFKDQLASGKEAFEQIVLPTMEGFLIREVREIVRCEADRNYTIFRFLDGKKYTIPRTLKSYEELLSKSGFYRIHQSHLVNMKLIKEFKRRKKGGTIILKDGTELPVSDNRKKGFVDQFIS